MKPFGEVRALIRSKLIRFKRDEIRLTFIEKSKESAGISINKELLDGVVFPFLKNNNQKPELPSFSLKPENQ